MIGNIVLKRSEFNRCLRITGQILMQDASSKKIHTGVLVLIIGGILFGTVTGVFFALIHDMPQIRALENYRPSATTKLYSADQVLLAEFYVEKRVPVPLQVIPHFLKSALIATEDRNFYRHSGVDIKGILRAIIKDIWAGQFVEGASTITQQLSKTLFLSPEKTIARKIKEALLAFQLERRYTKDEILELYLNQVYFGSGAYGVESASRIFFGKSVQNLNLAECALIAALPKAPSRYSPLVNPSLAKRRRNVVLKQMRDTGIIPDRAYENALAQSLDTASQNRQDIKAPYFVDYVSRFLEDTIGSSNLYKGGLTVETSLSYELQKAAEHAVTGGIAALARRMKQKNLPDSDLQGALIALDVRTGKILSMVGGRAYSESFFNRAVSARRQPGSAFKPIVYAHAIEHGWPQSRLVLDSPVIFKGVKDGDDWRPKNFSNTYRGEMTLRKALAISENIPAVRLIEMLGPEPVAQFARQLGIQSALSANLSLALGTSETTLIELTSAYAVFPNRGIFSMPYGITRVLDHEGRLLWQAKPQNRVAMTRSGAAVVTNMLEGVILEGTGKKARVLKHPVAGKTGTTNDCRDALFIGFSPSIAAGVWVGRDSSSSLGKRETGAKAALPIWIDFMAKTVEGTPYQYFDIPDDVVQINIDTTTGARTTSGVPGSARALFKKGTEPKI